MTLFLRWARRHGPPAFVLHGFDGLLIAPRIADPCLSLLIVEGHDPHLVAQEILRRKSRSNATAKAFWNGVQSLKTSEPCIVIRGEIYRVTDKATLRRLYDLYLMYATADARPEVVRAVAMEAA